MLLPDKISKGDTIGLFTPSYPALYGWVDGVNPAVSLLQEQRFNIKYGSLTGKKDFYRSGSIQARADELNELIHSAEVKCIMAISGGSVSNSLLPYIDYDYLKKNPKIIIGFSDITAILLAVYAKMGLVTYYGPTFSCLGRKPPLPYETFEYMSNIISKPNEIPYTLPTPTHWTEDYIDIGEDIAYTMYENNLMTLNSGIAEGRLIACNLDAETVEKEFSMLKVSGVFDKTDGIFSSSELKHFD